MGTDCALLVADLFLFCFERDFMTFLSNDKQSNIIDAFKHYIQIFLRYLKHQ